MKIHEYQGKEILKKFNVPVPQGGVAFTVDEAVKAAERIGGKVWVVIGCNGVARGEGIDGAALRDVIDTLEPIEGVQWVVDVDPLDLL